MESKTFDSRTKYRLMVC